MKAAASLARMELFAHFGEPLLEKLSGCIARARFPAGVVVLKQGDPTLDAYVIDSGTIRIQRDTPYGEYALARLGPGELFGEASFVDSVSRSGDACAETAAELLVLNPVALSTLLERDQRLGLALYWTFWKSLSKKLRQTNDKLSEFFAHGAHSPAAPAKTERPPTGEFHIGIRAKRDLFEEQALSSLEINFLSSLSREKKLKPGEVIFHEGEPGDALFVVLDGRVMISKYIPGAGEEALAFLERGAYFGEMALIDNQPRSADAKAGEHGAVVLSIPREVVEGILGVHRVSSFRLLKILCALVAKRLREVDDKIVGWFILAGGPPRPAKS